MKLIEILGNLAAVSGMVICFISGVLRLLGNWQILGFSTMTLFTVGIGIMVAACLAKLQVLSARKPNNI